MKVINDLIKTTQERQRFFERLVPIGPSESVISTLVEQVREYQQILDRAISALPQELPTLNMIGNQMRWPDVYQQLFDSIKSALPQELLTLNMVGNQMCWPDVYQQLLDNIKSTLSQGLPTLNMVGSQIRWLEVQQQVLGHALSTLPLELTTLREFASQKEYFDNQVVDTFAKFAELYESMVEMSQLDICDNEQQLLYDPMQSFVKFISTKIDFISLGVDQSWDLAVKLINTILEWVHNSGDSVSYFFNMFLVPFIIGLLANATWDIIILLYELILT